MSKKTTKRALAMSFVSVFLCVCMLVGTTFAWFTDSATSSNNKIQAGTLEVDLLMGTAADTYTSIADQNAAIFGANSLVAQNNPNTLWEPGKTQIAYLAVQNKGKLDIKYNIELNVVDGGLIGSLEYAIIDGAKYGDITATDWTAIKAIANAQTGDVVAGTFVAAPNGAITVAEKTEYFALAVHMKEEAGDQYQGKDITIDVTVNATQLASEADSFNNQYDIAAAPATSTPVTLPSTSDAATDTTVETAVAKVEVPAAVVGALVDEDVTSIALTHSELKVDTANNTLTFESVELVDQNGDIIDLEAMNNNTLLTVTLPATGIAEGSSVMVYHDGAYVTTATVTNGKISYEVAHLCEVELVPVAKYFSVGKGTAEEPFIIKTAADLTSISDMYDVYSYYKVADGVKTLDMTGVGKLKLNGSFDGNGVTMNNLTTALFLSVGKVGVAQDIKISNLTANVNTTDGNALVRNIYNPGTTTFEKVTMHGYIEGKYNMGSFYNYGTANVEGSEGADYTVSFVNATSDVTLVCTSGNAIGGMLGHGYEGADYKLSINMDANSKYTGKMYTTGTATCYQVMAMCSHETYVLNGAETSRYTNTYPSTKLDVATPAAAADGYHVTPAAGVDHYVVSLEAQLTAYDENGVKIPNMAGLTWSLGKETITTGFEGKIFDLITSAEIVNDESIAIGYEVENGGLKVYTGRDVNYASGWITLIVTQYDAEGSILATGNVRVHTFAEP